MNISFDKELKYCFKQQNRQFSTVYANSVPHATGSAIKNIIQEMHHAIDVQVKYLSQNIINTK